jgi:hypothetical protein
LSITIGCAQCENFSCPEKTLDQSCLNPSTCLNLKTAPSPLCSPSHNLCATAYKSRFFLRETSVLVEVEWTCNKLSYVNLYCHHFTIIIYDFDVPRFTTFQSFVFFFVFFPKKHITISADINLLIIHTEALDKFLGMVHIFRQLIRIQKDIP